MQQCKTTDAFLAVDIENSPMASGIVRSAKKILNDGAVSLARSTTYTFGRFGVQGCGASGGINALDDARPEAVAAFVAEISEIAGVDNLSLRAGKGVTPVDLESLSGSAPLEHEAQALAAGIVASAGAGLGKTLDGITVTVEDGPHADAISAELVAAGAKSEVLATADALGSECDVLVVGSKTGLVDHLKAEGLRCSVLIPSAPLAVTARGLAVAQRSGVTVIPDFISIAAPELLRFGVVSDPTEAAERIAHVLAEDISSDDGLFLAACGAAETFIASWTEDLPFGRPLA